MAFKLQYLQILFFLSMLW